MGEAGLLAGAGVTQAVLHRAMVVPFPKAPLWMAQVVALQQSLRSLHPRHLRQSQRLHLHLLLLLQIHQTLTLQEVCLTSS